MHTQQDSDAALQNNLTISEKSVVRQAFFPAEKQQILGKCCTTDRCPQNRCNRLQQ